MAVRLRLTVSEVFGIAESLRLSGLRSIESRQSSLTNFAVCAASA